MKLKLTPVAFAVCSALPLAAQAAPKVSFVAPLAGATISKEIYQSSACEVKGSGDIRRVVFFLDSTQLNTEGRAPWTCNIDPKQFETRSYNLRAVAYDSRGASTATQIGVKIDNGSVSPPPTEPTPPPSGGSGSYSGTPYSGTPVALPKAFAAVDFDRGGQGVAYNDRSSGNSGGQYRTGEGVDIVAAADSISPYTINSFQSGEWLAYTVNVPTSGKYDLGIRLAHNYASTPAFHIEVDGVDVTGRISVPKTGGWSTYQWVGKPGVDLAAGKHVLKVVADAEYFNMNGVSVLAGSATTPPPGSSYSGTPFSGTPIALPKLFPAADFDRGGQGVAYDDKSKGNAGGQYRTSEDVDIVAVADTVSPYTVNGFQTGEWLAYTVNVPASGKYDIGVRAAHNYAATPAFHIEVDGVDVTGRIGVPKTGGWSTYQWAGKQGVDLAAGKRVVKVVSDAEYFNMSGVSVLATAGTTPTTPPPSTGMSLTFDAPQSGDTISAPLVQSSGCQVSGTGISRVEFSLDATPLNAEGNAPWQCNLDPKLFPIGTHKLRAKAYDTNGGTAQAEVAISTTGGTGDGGGSTPPSGGTNPANLLFWSEFDGSTAPGTPYDCYSNGCYQDLVGSDSTTGFAWPPKVSGSNGRFQLLVNGSSAPSPSTVYSYMYNQIQTVTGPKGSQTKALYSYIGQSGCCGTAPQGSHSTQNPYILFPTSDVKDLYVSYWIKFQPDLKEKLHAGDAWRPVFEFKTAGDDYRFMVSINAFGGAEPYWDVQTNTYVPSYQAYWRTNTNGSLTVPAGKWMKLEVYWHRSSASDGRIWAAVDGKVIADKWGANMGPNKAPINRIMLSQLYSGSPYPIYQWVDDVQIWSTFPTVSSGDKLYNAPYAAH